MVITTVTSEIWLGQSPPSNLYLLTTHNHLISFETL